MRTVEAAPRAAMLIESMRDIGYSLGTALADVIDNSITAQASQIELFADSTGKDFKISVVDDGYGMSEEELLDAMRPGSQNPLESRSQEDLGRFGLGLKTASFSQCRKLTVVTRKEGKTSAAIWDLDYVALTDKWLLQIPDDPELLPWADQLGATGTLVIWEDLDRVVEREEDGQDKAGFIKQIDEVRSHLELVFHRYLTGDSGFPKTEMSVNGRSLEPFDPFNSFRSVRGPEEVIKIGEDYVKARTFTLPHHKKVSNSEWAKYEGERGYLSSQGFYVYRQGRLIIHSTWFGLARHKELTKLARVRIDMPNTMDAAWKIDVKKASARPPKQVREHLRAIIETIGETSRGTFTKRGTALISDQTLPLWNRTLNKNEVDYRVDESHPAIIRFEKRIPSDLTDDFHKVLELVGSSFPVEAIYADFGNEPNSVNVHQTSDETLEFAVLSAYEHLVLEGALSVDDLNNMLSLTEPFKSHWDQTQKVLDTIGEEADADD